MSDANIWLQLQRCQPLCKMRNCYAFLCHLRYYARKGNLLKLCNLRVRQIKSFRPGSLVTDPRGSLSTVSTTSCQNVLRSSSSSLSKTCPYWSSVFDTANRSVSNVIPKSSLFHRNIWKCDKKIQVLPSQCFHLSRIEEDGSIRVHATFIV